MVALSCSAASIVVVSGTSRADSPLQPLAPVTKTVATATTATKPVTQAVTTTTKPAAKAVTTAAKPVAQTTAAATKSATQAATTVTQPVTQAATAVAKPVTQAAATATKPVTQAVSTVTKPVAAATTAVTEPLAQATTSAPATANAAAAPVKRKLAPVKRKLRTSATVAAKPVKRAAAHASAPPRPRATHVVKHATARPTVHLRAPARVEHTTPGGASPAAKRIHVVRATGQTASRAIGGGRLSVTAPPSRPLMLTAPAAMALSPFAITSAAALPAPAPAVAAPAPVTAAPSGGDSSSSTPYGVLALIGAGGAMLLRARQLSAASGLDDAGTLTALAHSASTFWAGSCFSVGSSATATSAPMNASPTLDTLSPLRSVGGRSAFGVEGVISRTVDAEGGRVAPAVTPLAREVSTSDRTGLVAALLAASAVIGAVLGALGPRGQGADAK